MLKLISSFNYVPRDTRLVVVHKVSATTVLLLSVAIRKQGSIRTLPS